MRIHQDACLSVCVAVRCDHRIFILKCAFSLCDIMTSRNTVDHMRIFHIRSPLQSHDFFALTLKVSQSVLFTQPHSNCMHNQEDQRAIYTVLFECNESAKHTLCVMSLSRSLSKFAISHSPLNCVLRVSVIFSSIFFHPLFGKLVTLSLNNYLIATFTRHISHVISLRIFCGFLWSSISVLCVFIYYIKLATLFLD